MPKNEQRGEERKPGDRARKAAPTEEQRARLKQQFCEQVASNGGVVLSACETVNVGLSTVYEWRDADPDFRAAWDKAVYVGSEVLLKEIHRRAVIGEDVELVHQGMKTGQTVKQRSDTLLIFMTKGRRKEFVDKHEVSGPDGGPIPVGRIAIEIVDPKTKQGA